MHILITITNNNINDGLNIVSLYNKVTYYQSVKQKVDKDNE